MKHTTLLSLTLGTTLLAGTIMPWPASADQSAEIAALKQMLSAQAAEISALKEAVSTLQQEPMPAEQPAPVQELT